MKAIVLAAGYATRLYPLTLTVAKPLLTVGGRPMIDHILDRLHVLEDPVEDRAAPDRQELLRNAVAERTQPGRVPRCEDDRLHATTPGSEPAYGGR